jgi:crotonobetaine/carnitine-CoA ligase
MPSAYDEQHFGSVGRPLPGYEVMMADMLCRPLPLGAKGEILIHSTEPHRFMTSYLDNPAATAEKIRGFWFHTGDLGAFGVDGWLYYHGRLKNEILRRGENISAEELKSVADGHPAV